MTKIFLEFMLKDFLNKKMKNLKIRLSFRVIW